MYSTTRLVITSLVTISLLTSGVLTIRANSRQDLETPFEKWLESFISEARERGYSSGFLENTLGDLKPLERVIRSDQTQAEFTMDFNRYYQTRVTPTVIERGRRLKQQHRKLLDRIAETFDVPPRFILAIWGMESRYGQSQGRTPVFQALATLAWEPRRAKFFRTQLFDALAIAASSDVETEWMLGSWAGAMGQPQFMPSSYLQYAVDFDGDGKRNIWDSTADVLASIARYLQEHGWRNGRTWGREVIVPSATQARLPEIIGQRSQGCSAKRNMTQRLPLSQWHELGVRRLNGNHLPKVTIDASLVETESNAFLVYGNYDTLLSYNCAHYYALSVGLLADRLN